jgi:hypothetical protein
MAKIIDGRDVFEVVNEWPFGGYVVWNIGRHNFKHEGYLPLAQVDGYHVRPWTLKALYVGDEALCLRVLKEAGYHTVDESRFNQMRNETP